MNKLLLTIYAIAIGTVLAGCDKVTYPKEKVLDALVEVCEREYNVKVDAKVIGSNLGIHINFSTLFGENFDFKDSAMEILEDVLTSVRRVTLSTNSNFEFYTIVGTDQNNGVELVMTRYINDLKRVMLGNIGRNDYSQRMILKVRPDIQLLGERKIRKFFADMATGKIERIISNNFAQGTTLKDISSSFFLSLLELGMKEDVRFSIKNIKYQPISREEGLFYVVVTETYVPKAGYEGNTFSFPSDYEYKYLFAVNCENFVPGIKKIVPLNSVDSVRGAEVKFPREFARYENIDNWKENDFFLKEVTLPEFLAHQIAQRIRAKINADEDVKATLNIESVEGNFASLGVSGITEPEITQTKPELELRLRFKKKSVAQPQEYEVVPQQLVNISLDVVKQVCKSYRFEEFSKVSLIGGDNEELFTVEGGL